MPEGPECREVTEKLRIVKGQKLIDINFNEKATSLKYKESLFNYQRNLTCLDVICLGKQIFFFFEKDFCLFGGLGMEGHWYRFKNWFNQMDYLKDPKSHPKYCLNFGEETSQFFICHHFLWYDDKRNMGNITWGSWTQAFNKMQELGPDLLATVCPIENINPLIPLPDKFWEQVTLERFSFEIKKSRRQNMNICKFLMNQAFIGGIGNYLKSEILWEARISPYRVLSLLTDEEIKILWEQTLIKIYNSYQCGGLTHGTFLNPDQQKGTFQVAIYKKKGQKDPFGFLIRYDKSIDGRGTYFVPEIQI